MKKILIAIKNNFVRKVYNDIFCNADFEVLLADNGDEAAKTIKKEKPSVVIADVDLPEINAFELAEIIKKDEATKTTPVLVYTSRADIKEDKERAIKMEVRDFISALEVTPKEVVRKVKIILGEQKSYRLVAETDSYDAKKLMEDLAGTVNFKCGKCGSNLVIYLMRDLTKGENYYKVSLMCPHCL